MKKGKRIREAGPLLLGLLLTAVFGCFTSFAYDSASLTTCTVENKNTVVVTGTAVSGTLNEGETPDDGYYYLFELSPYEAEIGTRTDYISWCNKGGELKFSLPYSGDVADSMLYSRFVVALKTGNTYQAISNPIYITNPEEMASFTEEYPDSMSK